MINVALLGNPNVGKTTVFNAMTGMNQYVGNWPGVTIEKREGYISEEIKVVDLPGIYAMDAFSNEEIISKHYINNEGVDVIVNVVDAGNLSRNLYLTTQLMKHNKPMLILLNMVDTAEQKGINIDVKKLEKELGCPIIPMVAKKKVDISEVRKAITVLHKSNVKYRQYSDIELSTYRELDEIIKKVTTNNSKNKNTTSDKIDKIVLNPMLAYPIFVGLLFTLFKFTFDWVGGPLQELSGGLIESWIAEPISGLLVNSSEWFNSLIVDGIIGGLGGALPFFPLIFVLFFGITILEDSGYMARIAFLMDKIMDKVGLSGKSFIPMIMGMGCSSPAIMATRTLDNEQDRKITALIAPLMTCGARLPIYALFVAIFFPENEALIITSLYLLGIVAAIIVAKFMTNSQKDKESNSFIMELPKYSMPTIGSLLKNTWQKSKGFLVKVCTIMFAMSVVIWFLSAFNFSGFTREINESFLAYAGGLVAPIFKPLGFGDWRAGVSILTGLSAKEIVVSTMEILYGDLDIVLPTLFTGLSAYAFLVFSSLYTPCIAVLATMQKEYGIKMAITSFIYQFAVAWVAAFYIYQVGTLFTVGFSITNILYIAVTTLVIAMLLRVLYNKLKYSTLNGHLEEYESVKESI